MTNAQLFARIHNATHQASDTVSRMYQLADREVIQTQPIGELVHYLMAATCAAIELQRRLAGVEPPKMGD